MTTTTLRNPPRSNDRRGNSSYSFNVTVTTATSSTGQRDLLRQRHECHRRERHRWSGPRHDHQRRRRADVNISDFSAVGAAGTQIFTFNVRPAVRRPRRSDVRHAGQHRHDGRQRLRQQLARRTDDPAGSSGPVTLNVTVNGDNNPGRPRRSSPTPRTSTAPARRPATCARRDPDRRRGADLTITTSRCWHFNAGIDDVHLYRTSSIPAPPGGITFDIATAPGSATAGWTTSISHHVADDPGDADHGSVQRHRQRRRDLRRQRTSSSTSRTSPANVVDGQGPAPSTP